MKRKVILVPILAALFCSCDAFLVPFEGRNNPNDLENPVPKPKDFSVEWNTEVRDEYFIELTWTGDDAVEGYYIIKKEKSAPQNIFDGEPIVISNPYDTYVSQEIPDDGYGCRVYWAIFSFNPKWSDMDEDDKVFTHDGILENYNNYNFNGPVVDSKICYAVQKYNPSEDGYIINTGSWETGEDQLLVEAVDVTGADPIIISCLSFDLTDLPSGNIDFAELVVTRTYGSDWEGALQMDLLEIDWQGTTFTEIDVDTAGVVDEGYTKTVDITNSEEKVYIPSFDIFEDWNNSLKVNRGLRLVTYSSYGSTGDPFRMYSGDSSEDKPEFRLYYYED